MTKKTVTNTIPEQVTITTESGEVSLNIKETPELMQLINSVAKSEKDKLYSTIEDYKKNMVDAKAENDRLQSLIKPDPAMNVTAPASTNGTTNTLNTGEQNQAGLKKAITKVNSEQNLNLTQDGINSMVAEAFNTQLPDLLQTHLEPLRQKADELEMTQISNYRNEQLKALGDSIIPELVTGNTKEEIDSSIMHAKQIRDRYNTVPPQANTPAPTVETPMVAEPQATFQPTAGTDPHANTPPLYRHPNPEERPLDIKGMSAADFAAQRESLRNKLQNDVSYAGQGSL